VSKIIWTRFGFTAEALAAKWYGGDLWEKEKGRALIKHTKKQLEPSEIFYTDFVDESGTKNGVFWSEVTA